MEEIKKCDKCLEEKSIDNFYIKRGKPMNLCKPCKKARDKEYRETPENKEKIKQRNDYWNNKNKEYFKEYNSSEEVKLYKKEYKEKNRDRILEYEREYREKNKDEINQYQREYREKNKEKYKEYYEKSKETYSKYREKNKDKIRERMNKYFRERKEIDPLFKLSCNIRTMIYNSLIKKGYSKETKSYDILGIDYDELKLYFESKFESWMNWDNHGLYNGDFNYGWDIDHIIPLASAENEEDLIRLNHYSNLQPLCSKVNRDIKKSTL
jgi:hypothetical protein